MRGIQLAVFALVTLLLHGCAGQVRSNVDSFTTINSSTISGKIYFEYTDKDLHDTLEGKAYAAKFKSYLSRQGYQVVNNASSAKYIAFGHYEIGDAENIVSSYSVPIFGSTGGGTTSHSGTVYGSSGYNSYSGYSRTPSTFGVVGMNSGTINDTVYTRFIALDIYDLESSGTKPEKIFESRLTSVGTCGSIAQVIDELLQTLFSNFPYTTGRIDMEGEFDC
jgi:hypothetical protein